MGILAASLDDPSAAACVAVAAALKLLYSLSDPQIDFRRRGGLSLSVCQPARAAAAHLLLPRSV